MAASSLSASFKYLRELDDASSPLVWQLRWRVLKEFGGTSVGRSLVDPLRARFPLALTLRHAQINDTMILLDRADELSPSQRPPALWRNANLSEYTRQLMAMTTHIGLSGPRVWHSNSGEPIPIWIDWVPLMHAYLRYPDPDDESRTRWLDETVDPSESASFPLLPWPGASRRGRGRPRSGDEARLSVFADCVGRALADPNWTAIAGFANAALKRELTGGVVKINCRRLAKRVGAFKIF